MPSAGAPQQMGVSALKDPVFLAKVRRFYRDYKNQTFSSDQEMLDHYRHDYVWSDANLTDKALGAIGGLVDGEDERSLKRDLLEVHRSIPYDAKDWGTFATGMVLDPVNLIPIGGEAAAAAKVARAGGTVSKMASAAAKTGLLEQGALGAATAGVSNFLDQTTNQSLGIQDDLSGGELLNETLKGGAIGGLMGGAIGGIVGATGGRKLAEKQRAVLTHLGWSDADIATMDARTAQRRIDKGERAPAPEVADLGEGAPAPTRAPDAADTYAQALAPMSPEDELAYERKLDELRIDVHADRAEKALQYHLKDFPEDRAGADELNRVLDDLAALKALPGKMDAAEGVEPASLRVIKASYRTAVEDPSPENVRRALDNARLLDPEQAAGQTPASSTTTSPQVVVEPEKTPAPASDVDPQDIPGQQAFNSERARLDNAAEQEAAYRQAYADDADARTARAAENDTRLNGKAETAYAEMKRQFWDLIPDFENFARDGDNLDNLVRLTLGDDADIDAVTAKLRARFDKERLPAVSEAVVQGGKGTGVSKKEAAWANEWAKLMVRDDPRLSLDDAEKLALAKVLAQRHANPNPPVGEYTTKGLGPNGKPQPILRDGTPTSDGRTVLDPVVLPKKYQDGKNAKTDIFADYKTAKEHAHRDIIVDKDGFEVKHLVGDTYVKIDPKTGEVKLKVDKLQIGPTRHVQNGAPVPFRGSARTQVIDGENPALKGYAGRGKWQGKTVWYDPITKAVYSDRKNIVAGDTYTKPSEEAIRARKVQAAAEREAARATEARATVDASDPAEIIRRAIASGDVTIQDVLARLEAAKNGAPAPEPTKLPDVPSRTEAGNLAIRHRDSGVLRVLSDSQVGRGDTLKNLLGKANLEDWEIGHARGSKDSKQAQESFTPYDPTAEAPAEAAAPARVESISHEDATTKVLTLDDPLKAEASGLFARARTIPIQRQHQASGFNMMGYVDLMLDRMKRGEMTHEDVWQFGRLTDTLSRWGAPGEMSKFLSDWFDFQAKVAPERVIFSPLDVETSVSRLRKLGSKFDAQDLEETVSLLRRIISQNDGNAPDFVATNGSFSNVKGHGITDHITVNPNKVGAMPRTAVILHELGHWAYGNILSPEEKLHFWRSLDKYYNNDTADFDRIAERSPFNGEHWPDERGVQHGISNELDGPQEFFANQFSMWAMQNRASVALQDASFWRKVAHYVENLYRRYFKRETIDTDLVPLFEKILPDQTKQAPDVTPETRPGPMTSKGQAIMLKIESLRSTMGSLHESFFSTNDDDIISAAMDVNKVLYGIGRLDFMSDYGPLIFGISKKIDEAVRTSGSQSEISDLIRDIVVGAPFLGTKKLNLDDAVETIQQRLRAKFNATPAEGFTLADDLVKFTPKNQQRDWIIRSARRARQRMSEASTQIADAMAEAANVIQFRRVERKVAMLDNSRAIDFKTASTAQLAREMGDFKDTDYGGQIAHELLARKKAEPLDAKAERIFVRDGGVQRAMKREANDYKGLNAEVGVAPSARATIRDAQTALTHRDGEVQGVMRSLFYRLTNLAGGATPQGSSVLTSDLIARLANVAPDKPGMIFADATTTEFDALRSQLRRLAKGLTSDGHGAPADLVEDVVRLVARARGEDVDAAEVGKYLRGHVEAQDTPTMRTYRDAVGYVLNGQIGRSDIKAQHPLVDNYGSLFGAPDTSPPASVSGLANVIGENTRAAFEASSPARRKSILDFVGEGWGLNPNTKRPNTFYVRGVKVGDEDALTPIVTTDFGPGVRVYDEPGSDHEDLIANVLDHLAAKVGSDSDEFLDAADLADALQARAADVAHMQTVLAAASRDRSAPDYFSRVSAARGSLRQAEIEFDALSDELRSRVPADVTSGDWTQAAYIKLKNPLDMIEDFDVEGSTVFSMFADYAADHGLILNADKAEQVVEELIEKSTMTGREAYDWMTRLIDDGTGSIEQVRGLVNEVLRDLGFDGLVAKDHILLFDPAQVKHANAATFAPSDYLWGIDLEPKERLGSINSAIAQSYDGSRKPSGFAPLAEMLEENGAPAALTDAMGSLWRKRRLSMRENKVIREASLGDVFLAPNSTRMRKNGLHWLADWVAPENGTGHFERVASDLARIVTPITKALAELPDTKKGLVGWAEHTVAMRQPGSHGRIVSALRRGKLDHLSAAEQKAALMVREAFKDMLGQLVDAGVMSGEGVPENYFPQVWSKERILQKSDEFLTAMSTYLLREAKNDVPPRQLDTVEALKKAQRIYDNLVSDDGVFVPPSGSGGGEIIGDHLDYQRLIRLDKDKVALDLLEPFLEKDLGAITMKYFDTAVRKLDMVNRFGHGAHGWYDYLRVIEEGDEGIVGLLTSNKVFSRTVYGVGPDNERVAFELKRTSEMPFASKPGLARDAVATLNTLSDAAQMRDFLIRLAPREEVDPTYIRRVEAIVAGLVDRKKMGHLLHQGEFEHARQTLRVVQRKPVESGQASNQTMTRFYRALRNFNSVTLLSFTVLSSLGDSVMPLIKSGDFGAWTAGLRAVARRDPEYRQMLKNVGVSIENILHERMVGLYGTGSSKFTSTFFQLTGLTPWTDLMREVSGSVGYEWFKKEMRTAIDSFNPRLPIPEQSPAFAVAYRNLRTYGLDDLLARNVSIDSPTALQDIPELREALIKFANKTVFSPNADDLPIKAHTPLGQVLYQLKSFPIMMMRMVGDIVKGAGFGPGGVAKNERDLAPLLAFLVAAPTAGFAANTVKDVVQGRGGEEGGEHKMRQRLLTDQAVIGDIAQAAGMDPEDPGILNAILGQYLEGLFMIGGFGLIGDMIHDSAEQLDNGAYGVTRVASKVFGPSVGDFVGAFNVAAGASSAAGDALGTGDGTNSKERQAIREIVGRIPIVGGVQSVREGAIDAIAGEGAQ